MVPEAIVAVVVIGIKDEKKGKRSSYYHTDTFFF
jgi:hypothetical protein